MANELDELAIKYGTDKAPQIRHTYTPFYYDLLKERRLNIKKVLEIGAGEGASLRMWRDFFPNAQIYSADNVDSRIFKEDRIEVFKCDQSSEQDLRDLIAKTGSDIDLVVDDGSHIPEHQVFTCLTLMPLLQKKVIYVIEDVTEPEIIKEQLSKYDLQIPELQLVTARRIINNKKYAWKADMNKSNRLTVVRNSETTGTLGIILNKFKPDLKNDQATQIPNFGREELAQLFAELNFNLGAEIGVNQGGYSEALCKANPKLHLYSIDSWLASSYEDLANRGEGPQRKMDHNYKEAVKRLSHYDCEIIRKESQEAVKDFADCSLDFVYIDANHDFANVANDIHAWGKKVKIGGIISGHDYTYFPAGVHIHVKYVVDAYTSALGIKPYFELGVGRSHSWFWVKERRYED